MDPELTTKFNATAPRRRVFIVFSMRSISYAQVCILGLLGNAVEPLALFLIVDDSSEADTLSSLLATWRIRPEHDVTVITKEDIDDIASVKFAGHPQLRRFREGHPCWRKITDPFLLSEQGQEIIVLDPDLFFPNPFMFEPAPESGVVLMHQGPNCLFPPDAVRQTFDSGVQLADHVDIGVAQVAYSAFDLDWLEWLVQAIGTTEFTKFMHIEAIVWSAMAMREGGGYLDRNKWRCWQRGYFKRVAVAVGLPGKYTLRMEPLKDLKCIHVSGQSKFWVVDALKDGTLGYSDNPQLEPSERHPILPFTRARFDNLQRMKSIVRKAVPNV